MASQGGRWGSGGRSDPMPRGRSSGSGDGDADGARAPDQHLLADLRAELAAAVDAAFSSHQEAMHLDRRSFRNSTEGEGDDAHRWRQPSVSFGAASPLGGIPEAEWKVRALEEEVARMEAELRQEHEGRRELEQRLQETGVALGGGRGGSGGGEGEGGGSLGRSALSVSVELRSAIASAAVSSGLPATLRIQALAQSLSMLDEDLERERALQRELRQQLQQLVDPASMPPAAVHGEAASQQSFGTGHLNEAHSAATACPNLEDGPGPHLQPQPPPHVVSVFERRQSGAGAPAAAPTAAHMVSPFSNVGNHMHDPLQQQQQAMPTQRQHQLPMSVPVSVAAPPQPPGTGRTIRADFEELTLAPDSKARKRGGGLWGWLTGADMGHGVLG